MLAMLLGMLKNLLEEVRMDDLPFYSLNLLVYEKGLKLMKTLCGRLYLKLGQGGLEKEVMHTLT